ncbi:hypothetical protein PACTADRAFT_59086 [Pachysolen tannophilus NRRL Y-2460]|uniref:Small nuclear ribonucleoprotein Sm D2 n=1 Tax=Pachysolen tannophilus NRRL Y-2460 TaxID=669874 RepID=A0A1E4TSD7_PACTA|nr:hypothetical protein PACTADRAFT_59086 [Pachysolen tannophilus NRRL Y-2460]
MAELLHKPKSELTDLELIKLEEYEFNNGPMSILTNAIKQQSTILISLRNNHKLICKVKSFDRHCNMILENVKEIWEEIGENKKKILKERFISKLFLRGDNVIVILKHD